MIARSTELGTVILKKSEKRPKNGVQVTILNDCIVVELRGCRNYFTVITPACFTLIEILLFWGCADIRFFDEVMSYCHPR